MTKRILHHPVLGDIVEADFVPFIFNDQTFMARKRESVAAALLANGIRTLRHHEESGSPRSFYCNIGHCYECRLTVNGKPGVRACITAVEEGMKIESSRQLPNPVKEWRLQHE